MKNKQGWAGMAVATALALGSSAGASQAQTLSLAAHESAGAPGGATLTLDEVDDSRCRSAEHCSPSQAALRDALVKVSLRMADGQRYQGTIAIGGVRGRPSAAHPAHAKLGDLLVELVGITPEGRELPADVPGRWVQRAALRITPSDRAAVAAGSAVDLPNAGFRLRVLSMDDRRCPPDVACGVAGYVKIEAEVNAGDAPAQRLTFGSPGTAAVQAWRGHNIELCGVLPRRSSLVKAAPSAPLQAEFFVSPAMVPPVGSAAHPTCTPPIL